MAHRTKIETIAIQNIPLRDTLFFGGLGVKLATLAVAAVLTLTSPFSASAMQLDEATTDGSIVLAYAEPMPERFGTVLRDDVAPVPDYLPLEDEHEMNDAWLGMSVVSADGTNVGYVIDAFIDETGMLDELVVASADGRSDAVYVPAQFAALGGAAVNLTLSAEAVANLEIAADFALLEE